MAPSAHSTRFPPSVYWQVWMIHAPAPAWRLRLFVGSLRASDTYTFSTADAVASAVLAWDRLYTVEIDERTHPAIAEALASLLLRRSIVAWSRRLYNNRASLPPSLPSK